jgi:molybdopterin converting factor small subunit
MQIEVRLFATFRLGRFKSEKRAYADATTVEMIIQDLGITDVERGVVLVNGCVTGMDSPLENGDVLSLLPLVSGG